MKVLLIILINFPLLFSPMTVKGQVLYQDNFVKITGYISEVDSLISFQIENLSDSVLILNEKNINFEKIRANEWAADLSLLTSGASLLQPSYGSFMNFKRLLPKMKYTAIAYNFPLPQNLDLFKLFVQVDYMIIPSDLIIVDNILYKQFVELVNKKGLKINSYQGELGIKQSELSKPCKIALQSK